GQWQAQLRILEVTEIKTVHSGEGGAGLEEAVQESHEVQSEVVKGQRGKPKGITWNQSPTRTLKIQPLVKLGKYLRRTPSRHRASAVSFLIRCVLTGPGTARSRIAPELLVRPGESACR